MPSVANHRAPILIALAAICLSGCAPEMAQLRQNFSHPGTAAYQRSRAIKHDPYVLNDVGPEVVGGRPREYMIPVNEVERARQDTIPPLSLRPAAPAPAPVFIGPAPGAPSPYTVQPAPGPPTTYSVQPAPGLSTLPPTPPPIVTTPMPPSFAPQQRPPY